MDNSKKYIKYPEMDYFMNESLSDIVFVIEGKRLPAIKQLLSIKSKVFRAMFSGNFKESKDKEIIIEGTTYKAFETFIRFIYCEQLVLSSIQDFKFMREVCKLSDRYQVLRLMDSIAQYFNNKINDNNFEEIASIAFEYKINGLKEMVKQFIKNNFNQFVHKEKSQIMRINKWTDNYLFEIITEQYLKAEKRFKPFAQPIGHACCYSYYPTPPCYHKTASIQRESLKFDFDKID